MYPYWLNVGLIPELSIIDQYSNGMLHTVQSEQNLVIYLDNAEGKRCTKLYYYFKWIKLFVCM